MSVSKNTIHLKDYCAPLFSIESVDLIFTIADEYVLVDSTLRVKRAEDADSTLPLILHGQDLELQSISLDGQPLTPEQYVTDSATLTIGSVPHAFTLTTQVKIYPQQNQSMMGLYRSRGNYCTQCEAEGFRKITYFLDRPDVMTRFSTKIIADQQRYPNLLSNGNCIASGELADGLHWVQWQDPSLKPCYLFALVAGDFDLLSDTFITQSQHQVALRFYVEKGFKDQAGYALESLKRAMRWDEETYGLEYDLDIYMVVAVSDFNMGAMENKGLNIFNTKYVLADKATAADSDYVNIETVIGHEYFHNWTGNRVTCRDWFQLTLKEGLTVFRDQNFTEDMTSAAIARLNEVNVMRASQFVEDAGVLAHPIRPPSYMEINNFYTLTVYRKGAEVIRMLRTIIGVDAFRRGMDLYFERHDGSAVTTEDFVAAMATAAQRNLDQFQRWYQQVGTPTLTINTDYNPTAKTYTIEVTQSAMSTTDGEEVGPLQMPCVIGLLDTQGHDLEVTLPAAATKNKHGIVLELTETTHEFVIQDVPELPVLSLNRYFSAPVNVNYEYSLDQLAWLVRYDSDVIAVWDAAQQLGSRLVLSTAQAIADGQSPTLDAMLVDCWRTVLHDLERDPYLIAQLLALPSLSHLMLADNATDFGMVAQAHAFYRSQVARELEADWLARYQQLAEAHNDTLAPEAMGKRALQNVCLYYLVQTQQPQYIELALQQMRDATNMTLSLGALTALSHIDSPVREEALTEFYQKWQQDPLVVNKWLQVQALSERQQVLADVKALTQHAAYDAKNPNNVYALICAFGANLSALHGNIDATAYQFLGEQVQILDAYNPQVAARVLTPLTRWSQLDKQRAALMIAELRRLVQLPELSSDVTEILQKSLAATTEDIIA